MIERDRSNRVEPSQVIFVWIIVSMPCDDVKRRVTLPGSKKLVVKLGDDLPVGVAIVVKVSDRGLEISSVCQPIRSNWSQFRKLKVAPVDFTYISTHWSLGQQDSISDAPRNHTDLVGPDSDFAKLCMYVENAVLRHNEKVTVRGVERLFAHALSCSKHVNADPILGHWITCAGQGMQSVDPIHIWVKVERIPSDLIGDLIQTR